MEITLTPWWNVVSTPQYLTSMTFSGGRNINTYIYKDNKRKPITITDNFVLEPLQGYLMSNNTSNNITLTLNFDTNNTDVSTLQRNVNSWWNLLWITNTDSPFKNIANSFWIKILDYTQMLSTNVSDAEYNFNNHVYMYSNYFYNSPYDGWMYFNELNANTKEWNYKTYWYQLWEAYPVYLEWDWIYATQPFPNKEISITSSGWNSAVTNLTDWVIARFTLESSWYLNLLNEITFSITWESIDFNYFTIKIWEDSISPYFSKSISWNEITFTPWASHTNKKILLRYNHPFTWELKIMVKSLNNETKDYKFLIFKEDPLLTIVQQSPASNNWLSPAQYKVSKHIYSAVDAKISDLELWAWDERILHTTSWTIITDWSILNDTFYETYGINDATDRPITKIKYKITEGDSNRNIEFLKSDYPSLFEIDWQPLKWWIEN